MRVVIFANVYFAELPGAPRSGSDTVKVEVGVMVGEEVLRRNVTEYDGVTGSVARITHEVFQKGR